MTLRDAVLTEDLMAEFPALKPEALGWLLEVAEARPAATLDDAQCT